MSLPSVPGSGEVPAMLLLGEGQLVVPAGGPVLHPVLLLALLQFIHSHLCNSSANLVNMLVSFWQTEFCQWPASHAGKSLIQYCGIAQNSTTTDSSLGFILFDPFTHLIILLSSFNSSEQLNIHFIHLRKACWISVLHTVPLHITEQLSIHFMHLQKA